MWPGGYFQCVGSFFGGRNWIWIVFVARETLMCFFKGHKQTNNLTLVNQREETRGKEAFVFIDFLRGGLEIP